MEKALIVLSIISGFAAGFGIAFLICGKLLSKNNFGDSTCTSCDYSVGGLEEGNGGRTQDIWNEAELEADISSALSDLMAKERFRIYMEQKAMDGNMNEPVERYFPANEE